MLQTLRIENLAVIESLEVEFSEGLNVLTGETGAGKSIILKSIDLLSGKKVPSGIVRTGTDKALIEGIFFLKQDTVKFIAQHFEEIYSIIGNTNEENTEETLEVLLKRIIDKSGRSKFYINGSLMTQGTVANFMEALVNATSQHEQKALLEKSKHRGVLDAFGVSESALNDTRIAYLNYKKEADLLEEFRQKREEFEAKIFRLNAEREELEQIKIKAGEREKLEADLEKANASDILESALKEAISLIEANSRSSSNVSSPGIAGGINRVSRLIEGLMKYDASLVPLFELIESSRAQISEIELQLKDNLENLDFNSAAFEKMQNRLGDIIRIEKKYRKTSDELVVYQQKITEELSMFEGGVFDEDKLQKSVDMLKKVVTEKEEILTKERTKISLLLTKHVNQSLKDLGLKKAEFAIAITKGESTSNGADQVQFLFNANPGEEFKPLDKVASGGEVSRLLLAIKSAIKKSDECVLQIFDEIDVGVSGAIAQVVGEKLKSLSTTRQVLIITHSAQVASLADTHIYIDKLVRDGRTYSKAKILNFDERLGSIARMLAGKEVTKEFEDSARRLLLGK